MQFSMISHNLKILFAQAYLEKIAWMWWEELRTLQGTFGRDVICLCGFSQLIQLVKLAARDPQRPLAIKLGPFPRLFC